MTDNDDDVKNIKHAKVSEDSDDYDDDHQSYDHEDDDDDNITDDDESSLGLSKQGSSSSWKEELMQSWQQHMVAILAALVATIIAYYYQRQQLAGSSISRMVGTSPSMGNSIGMMAPTTLWQVQRDLQKQMKLEQHEHLESYQRTANITFCGTGNLVPDINNNLVIMDFDVPKYLLSSLELHYMADYDTDDNYENVLLKQQRKPSIADDDDDRTTSISLLKSVQHPQYECIRSQLVKSSSKSFIKGYTMYYQTPSIESMYRQVGASDADEKIFSVHLSFTGFAAKFVNLSPKPILLYWDGRSGESRTLVGEISPFESISTATTPGQSFSVSPLHDHTLEYDRWVVTIDDAVLYYEGPKGMKAPPVQLSPKEQQLYNLQELNREFAKNYLIHAKRTWFAQFPRPFPVYPMWEVSYFGQTHTVHIPSTVPSINEGSDDTGKKVETKSYTMTVASVSPRLFTIPNFLSNEECDELLQLAKQQGKMKQSTVYAGGKVTSNNTAFQRNLATRSSSNSWLERSTDNLTDEIYRRVGHLLKIDESLLQKPIHDDIHSHYHSIAESLQIIRYRKSEQYTPHHDWIVPPEQTNRYQPSRYATVLMYLNDNYEGGHTTFPRAINKEFHDGIRIKPKKGTAVLFYNMLPDGNVDDLSQHGSEPITKGEKYAANLWVWEPMIN